MSVKADRQLNKSLSKIAISDCIENIHAYEEGTTYNGHDAYNDLSPSPSSNISKPNQYARTYSIHLTHTIISKPNAKTAIHSLTLIRSQMAAPPVPLWTLHLLKFRMSTAIGDLDDPQWRSQFTF